MSEMRSLMRMERETIDRLHDGVISQDDALNTLFDIAKRKVIVLSCLHDQVHLECRDEGSYGNGYRSALLNEYRWLPPEAE